MDNSDGRVICEHGVWERALHGVELHGDLVLALIMGGNDHSEHFICLGKSTCCIGLQVLDHTSTTCIQRGRPLSQLHNLLNWEQTEMMQATAACFRGL